MSKQLETKKVFEILIRENAPMLMAYIRSTLNSQHLVDDVFQETMITAWKKLEHFDRTKAFGPWLRGIAKNHSLNLIRKDQKLSAMSNEALFNYIDSQFAHIDEQEGFTWKEKTSALAGCIDALPSIYKQAIQLRYLEEKTTKHIRSQIEISAENLKKRLQRGKAHLLRCLRARNFIFAEGDASR